MNIIEENQLAKSIIPDRKPISMVDYASSSGRLNTWGVYYFEGVVILLHKLQYIYEYV